METVGVVAYTYGETSYVIDVATNEVILQFPLSNHPGPVPDGYVQLLNHDGSRLLAGERPIAVWDVAAGEIVAEFHGHPGEVSALGILRGRLDRLLGGSGGHGEGVVGGRRAGSRQFPGGGFGPRGCRW